MTLIIDQQKCEEMAECIGECLEECPSEAIISSEYGPQIDVDKCSGCGACISSCPADAITREVA